MRLEDHHDQPLACRLVTQRRSAAGLVDPLGHAIGIGRPLGLGGRGYYQKQEPPAPTHLASVVKVAMERTE